MFVLVEIEKTSSVRDGELVSKLWDVYAGAYRTLNQSAPCRQSFHKEEFLVAAEDPDIVKFILWMGGQAEGIGFLTNRLHKVPWISVPYFQARFSGLMTKGLLYYLMGIAISPPSSSRRLGIRFLREMIESLPETGAVAFDYSHQANRVIPIFAEKALNRPIQGEELDAQIYCIYQWGAGI